MINNKIYQSIFNEILPFLPDKWEKVIVYLEQSEYAYTYSFYVKTNNCYIKCFNLGINENELLNAFERINKKVSAERNKFKNRWSNMTMVVDAAGHMKTDFDYTDLTQNKYQYKKEWKNKYLK